MNGVQIASNCNSYAASRTFTESISLCMHKELIQQMKQNPQPVSIICDGTSDSSQNHLFSGIQI